MGRVRTVLGLAFVGLLAYLVFGEKPGETAELLRQGENVGHVDLARFYRYWVSAGNAGLVVFLWWLAPRFLRSADETPVDPALAPPAERGRAFAWLVAGAVLCTAVLAGPRLDFSFWDDEEYTVLYYAHGLCLRNRRGELVERDVHWPDSFIYKLNRAYGPNNHVPHTLLVRLSLDVWQLLVRPDPCFASERVARMPAFLFGLAAIAASALLLRRLGFPSAGVFVAWLLAVHPWMLRYVSEARGYSLVLLLLPVLLMALLRAFECGSWWRWAAFAAAGALILWTYSGAALLVATANLAVVAELIRRRGEGAAGGAGVHARRWLFSTLLAAGVWAQLALNNFLVLTRHLDFIDPDPSPRLLWDTLAHVWSGTFWKLRRWQEHYAELTDFAGQSPWLFEGLVALAVAMVLLGAARLLRRGGVQAWIAAVLVLPAPLTFALAWLGEAIYHAWYVLYAVPSLAILLGIGFETVFARLAPPRRRAVASVALMGIFWAGYVYSTQHVLRALRAGAVQQTREAVALMRPVRNPFDPANEAILTASWSRTPRYYDPRVQNLHGGDDLLALMREADAGGKSLFVTYTSPVATQRNFPELVALSQDPELFEEVGHFYGFEPRGHMLVFRYRGRP